MCSPATQRFAAGRKDRNSRAVAQDRIDDRPDFDQDVLALSRSTAIALFLDTLPASRESGDSALLAIPGPTRSP